MPASLLWLPHFLPVLLSHYILSYPLRSVLSAIFFMPFSFPTPPSLLIHSTTMFPFASFTVLWLHHKLLLQPRNIFTQLFPSSSTLFFCCTFTLNCLWFPHSSIFILLFSFRLTAFSFSLGSSHLDLPTVDGVVLNMPLLEQH